MTNLFFQLLHVSLGISESLSRIPTEKEWAVLADTAMKQSLVGVTFAGVQRLASREQEGLMGLGLNDLQIGTWMCTAATIQQRNQEVDRQCQELQKRLAADGLRSCILKGQGVARLYDEAVRPLRQSGDIDIWIDAPREKVVEYVMSLVPTPEVDEKHIHFNCFTDTPVEAHWSPVKWDNPIRNKILGKYFDAERERQFTNIVDGLCVPTLDLQLAHQLLHVYRHYVYEGVGLRQVMDLYYAQIACKKTEEGYQKVVDLFKKLGLMRFVAATQWVLMEVFKMSEEQCICSADEKEGRLLLNEIMTGGNFGHFDERNHVVGETFMQRFFRRWGRRFRMFRFDPLGTLLMPFTRLELEIWMRKVRKQYGV